MQVVINGRKEDIQVNTLGSLLELKKIEENMVTIELNEKMIARGDVKDTALKEGDQLELLFFMGGGSERF